MALAARSAALGATVYLGNVTSNWIQLIAVSKDDDRYQRTDNECDDSDASAEQC